MVTGQAPVTLELRNTPGKNTHNPRWYTHISQLTQFTPPPETYKSEIGSQSTMCQVQAGAYVSLLTPGGTKYMYSDCHSSKTTTYILHVVSITTHTHDRHKPIGEIETKKRKEDKGKERKEKKKRNKTKKASKEKKKTRKARKDKTRKQGKKKRKKSKKD